MAILPQEQPVIDVKEKVCKKNSLFSFQKEETQNVSSNVSCMTHDTIWLFPKIFIPRDKPCLELKYVSWGNVTLPYSNTKSKKSH